jgi:hypothetical protein
LNREEEKMAEEFAQLEITLNEAAKNGNVDYIIALLKDVGKLHHLWQVLSRPSSGFGLH